MVPSRCSTTGDTSSGGRGSSAESCDRHEAVLAGEGRPNGVSNAGGGGQESRKAVVVDRIDGDGRMRLFRRHALVSGYEGREAGALGCGQEFVVAERAPVVELGGFDCAAAELFPEWLAQTRRYADVKEYLHAGRSGGGSAVGIAGCGGADGRCSGTQDRGGRPAIDLELAQELVQRTPSSIQSKSCWTGRRVPRKQGTPLMRAGSTHTASASGMG